MGVPVDECRTGALVWVHRKNGSWWPGRVLDPDDFSRSKKLGTPVKLLGKEDALVDWYNLENSKRVKAFRCGEFDDCIRKAESSQSSYSYRAAKYTHRGTAILHALELEKLEEKKNRKASGVSKSLLGEERAGIICRGKRSRRIFVSDESNNCWKRATINTKPSQAPSNLKMHKYPLKSDAADDDTSTISTGFDASEKGSTGRLQTEIQLSDAARNGVNESRYFGKHYVRSVNFYRKGKGEPNDLSSSTKPLLESQNYEVQEKQSIPNLTKRQRLLMDGKNHEQSPSTSSFLKKCSSKTDDVVLFPHRRTETRLFDVEVTVRVQCGREHVPLVSLMSKTNRQAIVGHPIDIEELDSLLAQKDGIDHLPSDDKSTRAMLPPTWKRSKRTPVCYLPRVPSPNQEKLEGSTKPLKKRPLPLPVNGDEGELLQVAAVKGNKVGVPTCVPVKMIFEKLLTAVGKA